MLTFMIDTDSTRGNTKTLRKVHRRSQDLPSRCTTARGVEGNEPPSHGSNRKGEPENHPNRKRAQTRTEKAHTRDHFAQRDPLIIHLSGLANQWSRDRLLPRDFKMGKRCRRRRAYRHTGVHLRLYPENYDTGAVPNDGENSRHCLRPGYQDRAATALRAQNGRRVGTTKQQGAHRSRRHRMLSLCESGHEDAAQHIARLGHGFVSTLQGNYVSHAQFYSR